MLAAAVAAGWSTYLYWLPCRGSMLLGSIIEGDDHDGGQFSDLCLRRMDEDQGPWGSELNVVAMVLLGVAWLALVRGLRWQLRTKAVAALPRLATLAVALVGALAIGDAGRGADDFSLTMMMLAMTIELSAVVALVAILAWQPDTRGRHFLRLAVVLWGTTAFGTVHVIAEHVAMIIFSEADWDTPPAPGTSRSPSSSSAPS
jgi:cytochrome bd-type quinol oxidase subunit 2